MKLVRGCIPELIRESGKECKWRFVYGADEHLVFLKSKMEEEVEEFIENPSCEEAADMLEVVKAFCILSEIDFDDVLSFAQDKRETHGGFESGVVLKAVL